MNIAVFFFTILLPLSTDIRAQHVVLSEPQYLYNEALRASLEEMNREWGDLNLTDGGARAPIDFHNMIVRKNPAITDGLNSRFGKYRVRYLDDASLIVRWRRLRKEFAILKFQQVVRSEGRLLITIYPVWVSYRRGRLHFVHDSQANVYFRFDEANRKYILDNVRLAGV